MADQNNRASAANLNFPSDPGENIRGQFSVHFMNDRFFFLVSYSNNSDNPFQESKKTRP